MRNLLHNRRGSVAFATVIALIPLIGVIALGAEAGSWYSTKQHAQNAADAAAYSGAVQQACLLAPPCAIASTVDYSGKQFAAQNGFCNGTDGTAYPGRQCVASLPTGISRSVQINLLASWNGNNGTFVQAIVGQQQPAYLAKVLGLSTVNINASAVAKVQGISKPPCALTLTGSISFTGSSQISAPNCGLSSNNPAANALNFSTSGSVTVGSLSTVGGCTGSNTVCNTALTYMPAPIPNPFAALDGSLTTLCGANPSLPAKCGLPVCSGSLVAYTAATPCTNDSLHITGNTGITLSGVYFISGTLRITGTPTISGTATFILLPGATINNQGNANITINGPTTVPPASSFPAALQSSTIRNLFQYMSMYDASATAISFGGNVNINLTGNIYAPTAAVTFRGNPTLDLGGGNTCGQLVAASITFGGNATFDNAGTGCGAASQLQTSQYVQLVP